MIDCEEDDYIRAIQNRDLTLAAELGKTLLERNQELQCHIYTLQQIITEKNQEIKLLEKHLNDQKEALSNKLRHLEQIDYQNCELEKQIAIYKNTLDKEKFKIKDLNDAYNQLSIQYDELENEYKQYKYQQTHQLNTPSISFQTQTSLPYTPSSPDSDSDNECSSVNSGTNNSKKLLKRCSSETNICLYIKEKTKQLNEIENYQNLETIYKKWSQIFDSYSRKRLVKYKDESIKYKDENIKLNETIIQLKHDLDLLKTRYSTLNIDYEECQNINSSLETKLIYYERLLSTTQQQQQHQQRTIQSSTSSTSSLTSSLSSNNLWKHVDMIECDIDRHINNNNSANSNCKDDICISNNNNNNNNNNCSDFVNNNNNNLNDSLSTCLSNKLIKRLNDGSSIYASNDSINLLNDLISIKQQHIQLTKQYDNMSLKNEFDIYLQEHKDIYHQNNNNNNNNIINLNASTSSCNSTTSSSCSSNVSTNMKVDAQTQTKTLNNNNNNEQEEETNIKQVTTPHQTFVSSNRCPEVYKEIFSRIYETINSSKTII